MNPDVAEAIPRLERDGVLDAPQAAQALRVARGELVSVRAELRVLLYAGVLLATTGVGLLVKENLERIGPVAIATALGVVAIACLGWVVRVAEPFDWGERESEHPAFDYVLLLGAMLLAADLAYIEVSFTPLGAGWPWHLLIVAVVYASLAVRYDSRLLFSLAVSTFAAWRGVAPVSLGTWSWPAADALSVRINAVACGVLFVLLGSLMSDRGRKAHFEPVAAHFGWLLVTGALAFGALQDSAPGAWPLYALLLLAVGGGLALLAFRASRFSLFGIGIVAAYLAAARFLFAAIDDETTVMLFVALSAIAVVVLLVWAHRSLQEAG